MKYSTAENLLMELGFLIATALAWYSSLWFAFAQTYTLPVNFIITLLYIAAAAIYAVFADKWWNIPCMVYMGFVSVTAVIYLIDPLAADDLIIWAFAPFIGLESIFSFGSSPYCIALVIFTLAALAVSGSKYFPKEN